MNTRMLLYVLCGILVCHVQTVDAKKKGRAPAVAEQPSSESLATLTGSEQTCRSLALMAFHMADARDHGAMLTDVLIRLRQNRTGDSHVVAFLDRVGNAMAYDLYGTSAHVQPAQARRILETICITQGLGGVLQLYALEVTTPAMIR